MIYLLRAKRSERQRARGASFTWLMGTSRKAVSRKRSILDIWCWEQKVFVLTQLVDIWSEPARPDPTRPDRHAFERLITRKLSIIQKKVIRHKMFVNFIKLMYSNFRKILRIVFELWSFYWRWNFAVFCS